MGKFGGHWTEKKLSAVKQYLSAYTQALKKQDFTLWYVDAFAGKGYSEHQLGAAPLLGEDADVTAFIEGSPINALQVVPPFEHYLFIEQSKAHVLSLQARINGLVPPTSSAEIKMGDANAALNEFCAHLNQPQHGKHRAVVFLDPFATQVSWATVEKLGLTGKVDVWILFPMMAINRLLTNDQSRQMPDWEARLDAVFGVPEWRTAFYQAGGYDLFGDATPGQKTVTFEGIRQFYLTRLASVYGRVSPEYVELKNKSNSSIFALMFAVSSRNPKAQGIALKIATHIIKKL